MEMKREKATPTIPWSDAVDDPNNKLNNERDVEEEGVCGANLIILMGAWAAWPGGDLQERFNGHGLGGPGVDLQLEGLEERMCIRKQMTHVQKGIMCTSAIGPNTSITHLILPMAPSHVLDRSIGTTASWLISPIVAGAWRRCRVLRLEHSGWGEVLLASALVFGRDEVKYECANEQRAQLAEVRVILKSDDMMKLRLMNSQFCPVTSVMVQSDFGQIPVLVTGPEGTIHNASQHRVRMSTALLAVLPCQQCWLHHGNPIQKLEVITGIDVLFGDSLGNAL
ncbi:hypothetical protein BGY98DRAFT_937852 [Russula aff. rugulosa BPL654]|nr:hypothetical protein BGY98DRAFT_937852 [Russula aff. rugulosa BPL654]